jgi:hypothetical protein
MESTAFAQSQHEEQKKAVTMDKARANHVRLFSILFWLDVDQDC